MTKISPHIAPWLLALTVLTVTALQSACAEESSGGDASGQKAQTSETSQSSSGGAEKASQQQSDTKSESAQVAAAGGGTGNPNRPSGLSDRQEKATKESKKATEKNSNKAAEKKDQAAQKETQPSDKGSGGDSGKKPYTVKCEGSQCNASENVVVGYDKYHAHCHTCHGPNGSGSTFAPSLAKRLDKSNQGEFTAIVANGQKRLDTTTGTYKVMPAWSGNPEVMSHVGQLWAYLKARADGALPPVKPQPLN